MEWADAGYVWVSMKRLPFLREDQPGWEGALFSGTGLRRTRPATAERPGRQPRAASCISTPVHVSWSASSRVRVGPGTTRHQLKVEGMGREPSCPGLPSGADASYPHPEGLLFLSKVSPASESAPFLHRLRRRDLGLSGAGPRQMMPLASGSLRDSCLVARLGVGLPTYLLREAE